MGALRLYKGGRVCLSGRCAADSAGQTEYGWSIVVSAGLLLLIGQAIVWLTMVMCLVRGIQTSG